MAKQKMYRYYCILRPPMIGAVPRGMVNIVCFDTRRYVYEIEREAWGYVEYDKKLTPQQVIQFEMAVPVKKHGECNGDYCEL